MFTLKNFHDRRHDLGEGNSVVEFQLPKLATRVRFPSLAPFLVGTRSLKNVLMAVVLLMGGALSGCAPVIYDPGEYYGYKPQGIYHTVEKDQTLWQIAQAYQVGLDEIVKVNQIANVANIKVGQKILIPRAQQPLNVPVQDIDPDRLKFAWPVEGEVVGFFNGKRAYFNKGIKIQAPGRSSVRAARSGKVVLADYLTGYGQVVIVDHQDGFMTVYARTTNRTVKLNDHISKGDKLAEIADAAGKSFLYFEVRKDGIADDPLYYLPK